MMIEELKNRRVWIGNNEEMSRKVQEALFSLGCYWSPCGHTPKYLSADSLYIWLKGDLAYSSKGYDYYIKHAFEAITVDRILELAKEYENKVKVEANGKTVWISKDSAKALGLE